MAERLVQGLDLYRTPTWDDFYLSSSLKTPVARLEGVLNVVHSGAKSLEVLAMSQRNDVSTQWIINQIQDQTGIVISSATNTSNHFNYSMERMGIVEKGIQRGSWHLTPFGEAIKPAVIFFWKQLRDLQTHPMAVLNTNANGVKDADGNVVTTGTLTRARILRALYQSGGQSRAALANRVGFHYSSIASHIEDLDLEGITTTLSQDNWSGEPYFSYGVTTYGADFKDWFSQRSKFRKNLRRYVINLEKKFKEIGVKTVIDSDSLFKAMDIPTDPAIKGRIFQVIADCVRAGFVRKTIQGRDVEGKSLVELTNHGKDIVSRAINPLVSWTDDPNSVEGIRRIALGFNSIDIDSLQVEMAEIFLANSPGINRTADHKSESILAVIEQKPMIKTEIAHELGISSHTVNQGLMLLVGSNQVNSFVDPVSRRKKFTAV